MRLALCLIVVSLLAGCSPSQSGHEHVVPRVVVDKTALDSFDVDCGRYPTSAEGLKALITRPHDIREGRWKGPYVAGDAALADEWGHEFGYSCPGIHNTNLFDLYSKGPDGVSMSDGDDSDDIGNWKRTDAY